jgi:hypothetical protein
MSEAAADPAASPPGFEMWVSPAGVPHLVPVIRDNGPVMEPVTGPCATCGRHHGVLHFRNVRLYADQYRHLPDQTRCRVEVLPGYPYECGAKDRWPHHTVYRCAAHGVWWHQDPGRQA